jgi:hypothetical protein
MKNLRILFWALLSVSLFFSSCNDDDPAPVPAGKYDNGVFINNEGIFGQGNGSVSFYDNEKDSVYNEIFKNENGGLPLGDVVQSMARAESKGLILIAVNASNKVEVVRQADFQYVETVEVSQPRYIAVDGDNAYVSSWMGKVYVIDLNNLQIKDSINAGTGPEGLLVANGKLFIANSGGWAIDSTITVVNLSDYSTTTVDLNAYCPSMIEADADGNIWVLAKGNTVYDENWNPVSHNPSYLVELSSDGSSIKRSVKLFDESHPPKLGINKAGTALYYGGDWAQPGLFKFNVNDQTAPVTPFIDSKNYGFFVNPADDVIYLLQEGYTSNGKMIRYDSNGNKLEEFTVGLYPSGGC